MYAGKSGCIRVKEVVFRQIGCIRANWLYSGKLVVFGQCGRIRAKVVVFGQKWFLSGKSGCIRDKSGCIRENWLYSVKTCCIRAKVIVFGQGG